jgi:hypothetical protein
MADSMEAAHAMIAESRRTGRFRPVEEDPLAPALADVHEPGEPS